MQTNTNPAACKQTSANAGEVLASASALLRDGTLSQAQQMGWLLGVVRHLSWPQSRFLATYLLEQCRDAERTEPRYTQLRLLANQPRILPFHLITLLLFPFSSSFYYHLHISFSSSFSFRLFHFLPHFTFRYFIFRRFKNVIRNYAHV